MINVQADDSRYYDARNKASHEVAKLLKGSSQEIGESDSSRMFTLYIGLCI